jgi:hypothetical protein
VKPGSLKIAEIVSGFVCAPRTVAADKTKMQKATGRKKERQITKANSGRRDLFSGGENDESVYRSPARFEPGETME